MTEANIAPADLAAKLLEHPDEFRPGAIFEALDAALVETDSAVGDLMTEVGIALSAVAAGRETDADRETVAGAVELLERFKATGERQAVPPPA